MANHITGKKILGSMAWRFAERVGAKGVTFVVSILLARLLAPEVYGMVALVTVIINVLEVVVDSGLGVALVQRKDADDLDFSTVFFFNLFICSLLYIVMFFGAPIIATFYGYPELISVIRVLSISLIISAVKNVEQAYVSKTMQFQKFFFATIGGTIGAAIVGIILAYIGLGIWALVIQQLLNMLTDTTILWFTVRWRPRWMFSFLRLKRLFLYGYKIFLSNVIETIVGDIEQFIIGKVYSASDLSFFNRSRTFPQMLVLNVNASVDSVLFPAIASEQDDRNRVKYMTRRAIQISSYVISPFLIGLFLIAPELIYLLLGEAWMPCVPYVRIFSIAYIFYPINAANANAIRAIGRSDIYLFLGMIKKIIAIIAIVSAVFISPIAMAYGYLVSNILGQIINAYPNRKEINYSFTEQFQDIVGSIILATMMGVFVSFVNLIDLKPMLKLAIQIISGAAIYILLSIITNNKQFKYLLQTIKLHTKNDEIN